MTRFGSRLLEFPTRLLGLTKLILVFWIGGRLMDSPRANSPFREYHEKSRVSGTHERIHEIGGENPHLRRPLRLCCSIVASPAAAFANPYEMEGVLVGYLGKMVT